MPPAGCRPRRGAVSSPTAIPRSVTPSRAPSPMSEPAVNWHEGMFLRPHHFQAANRYVQDQLRQTTRWDVHDNAGLQAASRYVQDQLRQTSRWGVHYRWGVRAIDVGGDALRNYQFIVHRLEARLR